MSRDVAAKYPFHAIIFDYLVSKRTGILTFEPGARKLFFDAGQLVFANSDEPTEHFASILVKSGTFSQDQLDQAKQESGPGKSLGRQLKAMGLATSQQLAHALKQQITCIVDAALSQGAGDCQSAEKTLPTRVPKLKIQTLGLIIKSIFKMDSETFSIPIQLDQPLFKTAIGDLNISKIAIPPSYLELFNFLRENDSFSPDTLQEIAKLDGSQLKKMIYVLHQLGVIAFKKDSSSVQEPLAEITDDDTYQEDTLGEDALATVLPTTTPPKTDLSAANDPQKAIRQINLPSFAQGPMRDQVPTLRVQDPRKQEIFELEETVRQFQTSSLLSPEELTSESPLPGLEEAITLDQDLTTISRELDPEEMVDLSDETIVEERPKSLPLDLGPIPIPSAPIDNLQEALEQLQPEAESPSLRESLDGLANIPSFDESPSFDDVSLQDDSKVEIQSLLNTPEEPPSFDDISLQDDSKAELQSLLNTPGVDEPNQKDSFENTVYLNAPEAAYDTEPAMPLNSFDEDQTIEETQTLPTGFQSEIPDLVTPDTETKPNPTVIMPDQNQEPSYFIEKKPKKSKFALLKYAVIFFLVAVVGLVGFRLYQNKMASDLTAVYIQDQTPEDENQQPSQSDGVMEEDGSSNGLSESTSEESQTTADTEDPIPPSDNSQEDQTDPGQTPPNEVETAAQQTPEVREEDQNSQTSAEETGNTPGNEEDEDLPLPKPVLPTQASDTGTNPSDTFENDIKRSSVHFSENKATHSLVIMVACQEDTVANALKSFSSDDVYLFKRSVQGKPCWMFTWGAFKSNSEAVNARSNFPQHLRQGQDTIWIVKPNF